MSTANAKIERARQKVYDLDQEIQIFVQSKLDSITHQVDADGGEQFWIFDGETPVTPLDWSLEIGDIIYNFRAGLDHLIWQLVVANGDTPGRHNSFPIVESKNKFQAAMKSCLRGVHPSAQAIIEGFEPYKGGNPDLWRLNSLCNIDKHRHLHTCILNTADVQRISGGSTDMNVVQQLISLNKIIPHFGPVEHGTKLLIIPDSHVDVNFKPLLFVAFSDRQPDVTDLYVIQTMFKILIVIDKIVEALTPHL